MDKSFKKGLAVLEAVARGGRPRGVTELAREIGLTKSNAHRLLQTLVAQGFLRHEAAQGTYAASLKLWELGVGVLAQLDVRDYAEPYLRGLAKRSGEIVNLAILDGAHVLFIERLEAGVPVRSGYVGVRAPAHALATGKALLAFADEAVVAEACRRPNAFTRRTITDPATLRRELAAVRRQGYAMNRGEWRELVNSIAAPAWGPRGQPAAAIGVTGPKERMTIRRMRELLPAILDATAAITQRLGGHPPAYWTPQPSSLNIVAKSGRSTAAKARPGKR